MIWQKIRINLWQESINCMLENMPFQHNFFTRISTYPDDGWAWYTKGWHPHLFSLHTCTPAHAPHACSFLINLSPASPAPSDLCWPSASSGSPAYPATSAPPSLRTSLLHFASCCFVLHQFESRYRTHLWQLIENIFSRGEILQTPQHRQCQMPEPFSKPNTFLSPKEIPFLLPKESW